MKFPSLKSQSVVLSNHSTVKRGMQAPISILYSYNGDFASVAELMLSVWTRWSLERITTNKHEKHLKLGTKWIIIIFNRTFIITCELIEMSVQNRNTTYQIMLCIYKLFGTFIKVMDVIFFKA